MANFPSWDHLGYTAGNIVGQVLGVAALAEMASGESAAEDAGQGAKSGVPNYPGNDPTRPPSEGFEWRGPDVPGGDKGGWYNPSTGETLKPDLNHPAPIEPHWDYIPYKNGPQYRLFPDGTMVEK